MIFIAISYLLYSICFSAAHGRQQIGENPFKEIRRAVHNFNKLGAGDLLRLPNFSIRFWSGQLSFHLENLLYQKRAENVQFRLRTDFPAFNGGEEGSRKQSPLPKNINKLFGTLLGN